MYVVILVITSMMRYVPIDAYAKETSAERQLTQQIRTIAADSTPPQKAVEWQCWDDGAFDPCHRALVAIHALSNNLSSELKNRTQIFTD